MIQRIQTLFLLGIVLISIVLFYLPFSEKVTTDAVTNEVFTQTLKLDGFTTAKAGNPEQKTRGTYVLLIMNILVMAISTFAMVQYKNRPLQIKMSMLGGLLSTILLVLVFFYSEELEPISERAHYLAGVYLIAVQIVLFLAARRFISKDEKLVRAADRIR